MAKRQVERTLQTRLGKVSVDPARVIRFPRGIIGFEDRKEFTLLQIKPDSPFLMLQCVSHPELGLMVADPFAFLKDYEVKVGNAEQRILHLENIRQVAVLVTVTIPKGRPEETCLNLTGPILVNYAARIGLQIPQVDSKYPGRYFIKDSKTTKDAGEGSPGQGGSDTGNGDR
jgi:flagellar assembly factor FliW